MKRIEINYMRIEINGEKKIKNIGLSGKDSMIRITKRESEEDYPGI